MISKTPRGAAVSINGNVLPTGTLTNKASKYLKRDIATDYDVQQELRARIEALVGCQGKSGTWERASHGGEPHNRCSRITSKSAHHAILRRTTKTVGERSLMILLHRDWYDLYKTPWWTRQLSPKPRVLALQGGLLASRLSRASLGK